MALQRAVYRPRDAEHTVLHQVIALHLEAFLGEAVWRWPATARVCRSSSRAPRGRTTRRRALMLAILRKMRTTSPVVSHSPGVMAGESATPTSTTAVAMRRAHGRTGGVRVLQRADSP